MSKSKKDTDFFGTQTKVSRAREQRYVLINIDALKFSDGLIERGDAIDKGKYDKLTQWHKALFAQVGAELSQSQFDSLPPKIQKMFKRAE